MSLRRTILLTLAAVAGCAAPEAQEPQQMAAADRGEPAQLTQQVRTLTEQLRELRDRATRLEKQARTLQLANEQLEKQLQAAAGAAAAQRDEYKAQAAQLQLANERLRRQMAQLQKQLDALTAPPPPPAD